MSQIREQFSEIIVWRLVFNRGDLILRISLQCMYTCIKTSDTFKQAVLSAGSTGKSRLHSRHLALCITFLPSNKANHRNRFFL